MGRGLDYDPGEHGVSVIDAQNDGSPDTFAVLATTLGIPCLAVVGGDGAGLGYIRSIAARDFEAAFVAARCSSPPAGILEQQLLADGLEPELRNILRSVGIANALTIDRPALERCLNNHKTHYAAELAVRIAADPAVSLAYSMPRGIGVSGLWLSHLPTRPQMK